MNIKSVEFKVAGKPETFKLTRKNLLLNRQISLQIVNEVKTVTLVEKYIVSNEIAVSRMICEQIRVPMSEAAAIQNILTFLIQG